MAKDLVGELPTIGPSQQKESELIKSEKVFMNQLNTSESD